MLYLRYYMNFQDCNSTIWRIEILQENVVAYNQEEIELSADNSLAITWKEITKEEYVQSSALTVTLASSVDRQFYDLYHIKYGDIRLDLYKEGTLYWSGLMDTELYEEPFSYEKDYDVQLTFADFAPLDRLKFTCKGYLSLRELINTCIQKLGIQSTAVVEYISTTRPGVDTVDFLDKNMVLADNYYDEDGEPQMLLKVLESTLQPFDLHIKQYNGHLYIWDWNALAAVPPSQISWAGDDAVLGTDKVYNNIKVTFSPYANNTIIDCDVDVDDVVEEEEYNIMCDDAGDGAQFTSPLGFKLYISKEGKGFELGIGARYFKTKSIFTSSDEAGVVWSAKTRTDHSADYQQRVQDIKSEGVDFMMFRTPLTKFVRGKNNNEQLRLSVKMLLDVRYNPFETSGLHNEEGDYKRMRLQANFVYIPFSLVLRDAAGKALFHYANFDIIDNHSFNPASAWLEGEGSFYSAYLSYYDKNDRKTSTGIGGWQTNKQGIGQYSGGLPSKFFKLEDGEYIPLPPVSGYLELSLGTHIVVYTHDVFDGYIKKTNISAARWYMFKDVKLVMCDEYGKDIETKDDELNAWLNQEAQEELKIDTVLGTLEKVSLIAKGQIYDSETLKPQNDFKRAGRNARLEKLLIGTLYSQYAQRHNTLSGTIDINSEFVTLTDAKQEGVYAIMAETQYILDCISDVKAIEVTADEYDYVQYN